VRVESLTDFHLALPASAAFLKADLSKNTAEQLAFGETVVETGLSSQETMMSTLDVPVETCAPLRPVRPLCLDMGSFHLWMARHLYSVKARQILITNGQQTLGVALPWAIAASIVRPAEKVLSISGDGGFLFSAMELETAVRLKANIIHMVWIDGTYDMVRTQEVQKYGRPSGTALGPVDVVKYAEAFGAKGMMIRSPEEITAVLKRALDYRNGPVLIGVHVDYSDNHKLFEMVHADSFQ
jgi:acetolactate synthase I/II/III large subunit